MPELKITQLPVSNFSKGRKWQPIRAVVVHIGEGTAYQIIQTFKNEERSSHYLVNKDGTVIQFVDERDTAWTQGTVYKPTAKLCTQFKGLNPNLYCVSIETEGVSTKDITPAQYKTLIELVRQICVRNALYPSVDTILPHRAIRADKTCPGKIKMDYIISEVKRLIPTS